MQQDLKVVYKVCMLFLKLLLTVAYLFVITIQAL